jgi:arylformamidase
LLYRGMDRAALDAAYNNRAAAPDAEARIADWRRRSAALRAARPARLDLAYGSAPRQRLDFFPADAAKAPTLLYIHGGYWQMGDKEDYSFLGEGLLAAGINLAVVEYTLAPAARMDRIVAEVQEAARWLAAHLGELGGEPERLYVAGHSAGGHLTALTMPLPAVRGGIAISGLYDLEPIRLNYLNDKLGLDPAEARRNSPLLHLPQRAAPLVVAWGAAELPELCRQSREYAEAWSTHGLPGHALPIEGADHFSILEELARRDGRLTLALLKMVDAG